MGEEALAGLGAYAGDVEELRGAVADGAALAVIADGEAVALVADELDEMEDGGAAVEDYGLGFIAVDVDDFFFFCDGGEGLGGEAEGFEGFGGGVELAEAAIDEDERGHGCGLFGWTGFFGAWCFCHFFEDALVAAVDDFAHGGEVVYAEDGHDFEFAIGGFVHLAVFPDDERGDGFSALDVRDVETLDAAGQLGEHEGVGEGLLNSSAGWLEDAEALGVGLPGVLAGEIDEGALFSALGNGDLDAVAGALGEESGKGFAVVEVDGDEDRPRDVVLVDVELFEKGGEGRSGVKGR